MTAQLHPIDLVAPGFRGVNFEQQRSILPPVWATVANNCTIDENGLLASRRGYSDITTTAVGSTPNIETLHEALTEAGASEYILAWDDAGGAGISNSISDPDGNIVDGSVTVTSGTWWMQNGWGKIFGFQDGLKPIVRTVASGNFATVPETSGTAPTIAGGVGMVAYGRVWGVGADKQIIQFSALESEGHWSTGAGQIDMARIWTNGTDQVMAITAFGGALIVFGKRHIVFWVDGQGNQLGLDPDNLYVSDIIEGIGCESQWSVQRIGENDVIFLGSDGVHSLKRTISSGAGAPIIPLSRKVHTALLRDLAETSAAVIRSVVNPIAGIYVLSFPTAGRSWVFHYTKPYRDEATGAILYPITTWDLAPTAWLWDSANKRMLLGFAGNVGLYGGADTDNGTSFLMEYQSSWMDLGEQLANRLKMLKRIGSIIFVAAESTVTYKWDFDFRGQFTTKSVTMQGGSPAEWGSAEFGEESEYSGGLSLRIFKFPATGSGQYIKIGVVLTVTAQTAIQQLELFAKLGSYA